MYMYVSEFVYECECVCVCVCVCGGGRGRERIHEYSKVIGKSALLLGI